MHKLLSYCRFTDEDRGTDKAGEIYDKALTR
jgi:hypothetical protein